MSIRYTFMFIYLNFLRVYNLQNTIVNIYVEVIGSFLLPFASMKKVVNYIQFCEGPWIMVGLTEETKEMRKHNDNWLVHYVEGMEDD